MSPSLVSKVELIKENAQGLRGEILPDLINSDNPKVTNDSHELLKFHGIYQEFDRDTALKRRKEGLDKDWSFMARIRLPGGKLTTSQYLAMDDLATQYSQGTLRITSRQTFQFHGVLKKNLQKHIKKINDHCLTTFGACGDVVRNVLAPPAPFKGHKYVTLRKLSQSISSAFLPETSSYIDIWVTDPDVEKGESKGKNSKGKKKAHEPLYGTTYLPRKFKIAFALYEDNSTDALTNDLALFACYKDDILMGFNFYIGGGMGVSHQNPQTYPRLASPLGFVPLENLKEGIESVVKIHRDYGDRKNRKHARLKYIVEENGMDWAREKFLSYFGRELLPIQPHPTLQRPLHLGRYPQGDGKWFLGIPVPSGRLYDGEGKSLKSGLRRIIEKFQPEIYLTPDQDLILADLEESDLLIIEKELVENGFKLERHISGTDKEFLSCVALPTCSKALAESERVREFLINGVNKILKELDLFKEPISLRIVGCPNGCVRPYVAEVAIVGRLPGVYSIYLGGHQKGNRLNKKYLDKVPLKEISEVLGHLFSFFKKEKRSEESFGDFLGRHSQETILNHLGPEIGNYGIVI